MNNSTTKKRIDSSKKWIGLVLGMLFLVLAVRNTDLHNTLSVIKSLSILPIIAIVILKTFGLLVRGFRWRIVLEHIKKVSPLGLFRISSIGEMGNYLLPARVGEIMRIFLLSKKENISKSSALVSVFMDRFFDLITVLTLFSLFSFIVTVPAFMTRMGYIASLGLILFLATVWTLSVFDQSFENALQRLLKPFPRLTSKFVGFINRLRQSLGIIKNVSQILRSFFVSLILWSVHIISLHLVILALHINLPWYAAGLTAVVVGLGMAVPSTPGFIGTYEFFCVSTLTIFGVDKSSALACAIVSHGLNYVVVIIVGLISYMWENIDLGRFSLLKKMKFY